MFHITTMKSEKAGAFDDIYQMDSLEQFDEAFNKCEKGDKLGSGFIRGKLTKPERLDANLKTSKLLIIDADGGLDGKPTPAAGKCQTALAKLGYSHIIYTTHSHKAEYPKYRAIVELSEEIEQHELHANMSRLLQELKAHGCSLHYAHEMDTWSQIWFLPRSNNPENYIHLSWFDGRPFDTVHVDAKEALKQQNKEKESKGGEQQTLDEIWKNITSGKEFHQSMLNLTYQYAKMNMSRAHIIAAMRAGCEMALLIISDSNRVVDLEKRMLELDHMVEGAITKVKGEQIDEEYIAPDEVIDEDPLPAPGLIGKMIDCRYNTMMFQSRKMSHAIVFSTLSSIVARAFQVMSLGEELGLNHCFIIAAESSNGKAQIGRTAKGLLRNLNGRRQTDFASDLILDSSFTAIPSFIDSIKQTHVGLIATQEAGIVLGSKVGDQSGLQASMLATIESAGFDKWTDSRRATGGIDSAATVPEIHNPCVSFLMESTPKVLAKALSGNNALDNGLIGRFTILAEHNFGNSNEGATKEWLVDDQADRIEKLVEFCDPYKTKVDDLATIKIAYSGEYDKYPNIVQLTEEQAAIVRKKQGELRGNFRDDERSGLIFGRLVQKYIKTMALGTVIDHADLENPGELFIAPEWFNYGMDMIEWEIRNVNSNLCFTENNNVYAKVDAHIVKFVAQAYNNTKERSDKAMKEGVVLMSKVKKRFKHADIDEVCNLKRMSPDDLLYDRLIKMHRNGSLMFHDKGHGAVKAKCITMKL